MLGAIIGDVIGSVYEVIPVKYKDFKLFHEGSGFTDDTVLTVAVADHLMSGADLVGLFHDYYAKYPRVGYGKTFAAWAKVKDRDPYDSWGNGSAMRVSPVAWRYDSLEEVLAGAAASAAVTHNHPEGIAAAKAVAGAIFLARTGASKAAIRDFASGIAKYDLSRTIADIRPAYKFEVYAVYSVPEAIISFLESDSVEDAIRTAISLGGDADTQACIAGAIAEAYYGGVPDLLKIEALGRMDRFLHDRITDFCTRFVNAKYSRRTHGS
jgi:ADP-ribosylglycohydrolase